MRCTQHRRDFQGPCNWCGRKLCEMCIAKQEGRKLYCEHCTIALVPYKREKLPPPMPCAVAQPPTQTIETPTVKRRFVLGKDGYFELRG